MRLLEAVPSNSRPSTITARGRERSEVKVRDVVNRILNLSL